MKMKSFIAFIVAASAAAGCSAKPLQADASGGDGTGSIDIDAGQADQVSPSDAPRIDVPLPPPDATFDIIPPDALSDVPPPPDGGPDASGLFAGRRSFVVTSLIRPQQDAGVAMIPSSHAFTLILDGDQALAIAGANGQGSTSSFQRRPPGTPGDPFAVTNNLVIALSGVGCTGSVVYSAMTFDIDGAGNLSGSSRGQVSIISGDTAMPVAVTMAFNGVPDGEMPRLNFLSSGDMTDPFNIVTVVATEPLPPYGGPELVSTSGESFRLQGLANTPAAFFAQFTMPAAMLRYATGYRLRTEQIQDFATNVAAAGPSFTTAALPPLVVEDGFESVPTTSYGGAQVLSAPDPTITGSRSLYLAPNANPGGTRPPPLTVRLARAAGDTVIRFSYQIVNPGPFGQSFRLGSEGGSIATASLASDSTQPATPATIGTTAVTLGPILTATFPIPADASDAVVLQRITPGGPCGGRPLPPLPGMIIDDMRAE
jgi:hypothetical protein